MFVKKYGPYNILLPSPFLPQECQPSNAVLYANRASTYLKLKAYAKAVEDAQSAVAMDPTWAKVCVYVHVCVSVRVLLEEASNSHMS